MADLILGRSGRYRLLVGEQPELSAGHSRGGSIHLHVAQSTERV
jgi:hypothetical protein